MRKRRWVIYFFIFISVVAFTALVSHRLFETNERIREIVVGELRPIVGDDFNISKVHLDLSTIHFFDVYLPFADKKFVLQISDLRIGYNLFQAVSSGFNPASISRDILLIKPKFIISVQDSMIQRSAGSDSAQTNVLVELAGTNWLSHLQYLNRLSIRDGEIVLEQKGHESIELGNSLSGLIYTQAQDSLFLRLEGKLLSSDKENLFLESAIDRNLGHVKSLNLIFHDYSLETPMPYLLPEFVNIRKGEMEGSFVLKRDNSKEYNYDLVGDLNVTDLTADLWEENLKIDDLSLFSHVDNWNAIIDTCDFELNNAKTFLAGKIQNIFHPKPNLKVRIEGFNLSNMNSFLGESFSPTLTGTTTIDVSLENSFQQPVVKAGLYSKEIAVNNIVFSKLVSDAIIEKNVYHINQLSANVFNNEMNITGAINPSDSGLNLDGRLNINGDISPYIRTISNKSIDSCRSWLTAEISGDMIKPKMFGSLGLDLSCSNEAPMEFRDAFSLRDWKFRFIPLQNNGEPAIAANLDVSQSDPLISFGIHNAHRLVFNLWNLPFQNLFNKIAIDVSGNGVVHDLDLSTRMQLVQQGGEKLDYLHIKSNLISNGENFHSQGEMTFFAPAGDSLEGNYTFSKNKKTLSLDRLNIDDNLFLNLSVNQQNDSTQLINGNLRTDDFQPLLFSVLADSQMSGTINSDIEMSGTMAHPDIAGFVRLEDGYLNSSGPYAGLFDFVYDSTGFNLRDMNLNNNGESLLFAYGKCRRDFTGFNFKLTGGGFDYGLISKKSGSGSPFLKGRSVIDLNLTGDKKHPNFEGLVAIKDGQIFNFPFNSFEMEVGNGREEEHKSSPGLNIKNFIIQRNNFFQLNGNGFVPFDLNDSLSVSVTGAGDFLVLFSDLTDFFKKTASIGEFQLDLSGPLSNPIINDASLTLKDGYMRFGSVLPEVTNANMSVKYEPDRKFFNVEYLNGFMGGDSFAIHNEITDSLKVPVEMDDFNIGDTELSLGTFVLESGDNGIPLNITGLMEENKYGQLFLSGRTPKEKFYFGGPYSNARLRGRIDLLSAQIMYPFVEGTGDPDPLIKNLLETMIWDVEVVPIKDVRYIRSFPGAIDNLYVNLLIEEEFSKLEFLGQIRDESFRINGQVGSTTGLIEYLDMTFRIERAGAEFDNSSLIPVVYGNARTTVTDSMGVPTQVFLTAQTVDNTMRQQQIEDRVLDENSRGRWDQIRFRLSTDNPNLGSSENQILSALGYSSNSFQGTAFDAIGFGTDNIIFRPIFRPVERTLQNFFGLDYVRFNSRLAKNIIDFNLNNNYELNTRLALLKSTRVIVGKYLANNLFFQYTGQIQAGIDYRYKEKGLGLNHRLGFEYHINPKLLLELEYNYDTLMRYNNEDKRIILRHWFPF